MTRLLKAASLVLIAAFLLGVQATAGNTSLDTNTGEHKALPVGLSTETAGMFTKKRNSRTAAPRRKSAIPRNPQFLHKQRRNTTGTNAPAPLDCNIESHPDCHPPDNGVADSIFLDLGHPVQ